MSNILVIEPFYGGSHKQLIDLLINKFQFLGKSFIVTMPAKKWHWKARTSALQISFEIPTDHNFEILFCSSVLSLAELCGIRSDIGKIRKKIVYFHENQLVYPVQEEKHRDFQYGYNQITSSIAADVVLFNSEFNMKSFLSTISSFLKLIPDFKIKNISDCLVKKCRVLYYPIDRPLIDRDWDNCDNVCHIVWPHRWEHDKNPDLLFKVLFELQENSVPFRVSIVGEQFSEVPEIFHQARIKLADHIDHWGYLESKNQYFHLLNRADVAVSTANHEFYGVAMIEAALHGCVPICPDRLSYPEIFSMLHSAGRAHFYNTDRQLFKLLRSMCNTVSKGYRARIDNDVHVKSLGKFLWNEDLCAKYCNLFSP